MNLQKHSCLYTTIIPRILKVKYLIFIWVLINTSQTTTYAQKYDSLAKIGEQFFAVNNYDSTLFYFEKAINLLNIEDNLSIYLKFNKYINFSLYRKEEHELVIKNSKQVLSNTLSKIDSNHYKDISTYYNYIGLSYRKLGSYSQAFSSFQKMLVFLDKAPPPQIFTNVYLYLSVTAGKMGNIEDAINYSIQALHSAEKDSYWLFDIYTTISYQYKFANKYKESFDYLFKALHFTKKFSKTYNYTNSRYIILYNNIGHNYNDLHKYDSALYYYLKAQKIKANNKQEHIATYHNLGSTYMTINDLLRTKKHLDKALNLFLEYGTNPHPNLGKLYSSFGKYYAKNKNYIKALNEFQKGVMQFIPTFQDSSFYQNPSFNFTNSEHALLYVIRYKAQTFYHYALQTKKLKDFEGALDTYKSASRLIDRMRHLYEVQGSKKLLSKDAKPIFEGGIRTALAAYEQFGDEKYLELAYEFAEKGRAILLQESLAEGFAKKQANVPDSLLAQEHELKSKISYAERNLFLAEKKQDSTKIANHQEELFHLRNDYQAFIKQLESNYPQYHSFKYQDTRLSLADVQAKLPSDQALLSFFMGDSSVYTFTITSSDIQLYEKPNDGQINQLVNDFRKGLNAKYYMQNPDSAYVYYSSNAYTLYNLLLKDALTALPSSTDQLLIIPDAELGYVPFETLITETADPELPDYRRLAYLIKQYQINYAYSPSLLYGQFMRPPVEHRENVLAFAPSYGDNEEDTVQLLALGAFRDAVTKLIWNTKEIEQVKSMMDGQYFSGLEASEKNFKANAERYKLIHLAMHALVDDENPMYSKLVFTHNKDTTEDGYLHVYELFNMELNADLAILSACNTGYGKLEKGEGIMSLARGFAYAGCPSILMSHWQVDDRATAKLMAGFYEGLSSGMSKDEAIRASKLKYLESANPINANPFFWGSFVTIGKPDPVESGSWWLYALIGVVIFSVGGFLIKRKM